jgi:hypothetical protein
MINGHNIHKWKYHNKVYNFKNYKVNKTGDKHFQRTKSKSSLHIFIRYTINSVCTVRDCCRCKFIARVSDSMDENQHWFWYCLFKTTEYFKVWNVYSCVPCILSAYLYLCVFRTFFGYQIWYPYVCFTNLWENILW